MDPTRPILDLYPSNLKSGNGGTYYNRQTQQYNGDTTMHNILTMDDQSGRYFQPKRKQIYPASQQRTFQLERKYEHLLQEFKKKSEQVNSLSSRLNYQEGQNETLNRQLQYLREKNYQLSQTLIQKNQELQFAYKKIQSELRNGSTGRIFNSNGLQRLQENIQEAINMNFQMLKEQTTSQITKIRHL